MNAERQWRPSLATVEPGYLVLTEKNGERRKAMETRLLSNVNRNYSSTEKNGERRKAMETQVAHT